MPEYGAQIRLELWKDAESKNFLKAFWNEQELKFSTDGTTENKNFEYISKFLRSKI
jgi:hypothetical protein